MSIFVLGGHQSSLYDRIIESLWYFGLEVKDLCDDLATGMLIINLKLIAIQKLALYKLLSINGNINKRKHCLTIPKWENMLENDYTLKGISQQDLFLTLIHDTCQIVHGIITVLIKLNLHGFLYSWIFVNHTSVFLFNSGQ